MLTYKDLLLTGPEAVCVLDTELGVRQHNRNASLLLGYVGDELTGKHLSDILYDNTLIRNLMSSDVSSDWFQGECVLRTSFSLPLPARFRVGKVLDSEAEIPSRSISQAKADGKNDMFWFSIKRMIHSTPFTDSGWSPCNR